MLDEGRDAELVLAELAGSRVDDVEVAAVVGQSQTMTNERTNAVWTQLRRAPATVSMRVVASICW